MKCPRCHAQFAEDTSFCGICGYALAAPQGNGPAAGPSFRSQTNNEADTLAAPWGVQDVTPPLRPAPASASPAGWSGGQPGVQQFPQAAWQPDLANQPYFGASPEMRPGNLNSSGVGLSAPIRKRRRAGRIWARLLLTLVLLLAVLAGAWFFGVRPYLHNLVQTQLDRALTVPESQVLLGMIVVPPGSQQTIHGSESSMNTYLSSSNTDQVQNLHMTITPASLSLSFTSYGQNCSITALPILSNGQLQVTNVQVQGLLELVMSNDELTSELNNNLQTFSSEMTHKITKITLLEHEIDVQIG